MYTVQPGVADEVEGGASEAVLPPPATAAWVSPPCGPLPPPCSGSDWGNAPEGPDMGASAAAFYQTSVPWCSAPGMVADYSIPAAWGPPSPSQPSTDGGYGYATWPPTEAGYAAQAVEVVQPPYMEHQMAQPWMVYGLPVDAYLQYQQQCHVQQLFSMCADAAAEAKFLACQQQQAAAAAGAAHIAYAISPPQQQRRLARRKKTALPAEPSYGSTDQLAAGSSSSVLLFSGEASLADGDTAPGSSVSPRSGAGGLAHSTTAEGDAAQEAGSSRSAGDSQSPSIEFDRAPRPVAWKPYSLKDYQQRNYDPKHAKYWALGGLGPIHGGGGTNSGDGGAPAGDAQWQAQQGKRDRQQQFGHAVSRHNRQRLAAQLLRPRPPAPRPGADVRQRALHFARTAVPKPSASFNARQQAAQAAAAVAAGGMKAAAGAGAAAVLIGNEVQQFEEPERRDQLFGDEEPEEQQQELEQGQAPVGQEQPEQEYSLPGPYSAEVVGDAGEAWAAASEAAATDELEALSIQEEGEA